MATKLIPGYNFFHSHPLTENMLGLDEKYVIIDRKDYEMVLDYVLNDLKLRDEVEFKMNTSILFKQANEKVI